MANKKYPEILLTIDVDRFNSMWGKNLRPNGSHVILSLYNREISIVENPKKHVMFDDKKMRYEFAVPNCCLLPRHVPDNIRFGSKIVVKNKKCTVKRIFDKLIEVEYENGIIERVKYGSIDNLSK